MADLPNNEERATFILKSDQIESIRDIAYWDRKIIKDVMFEALADYIKKYEKKNGPIKSRPEERKAVEANRSKSGRR